MASLSLLSATTPTSKSALRKSNTYLAFEAARECAAAEVAALRMEASANKLVHLGASGSPRPTANVAPDRKGIRAFKVNGQTSARPKTPGRESIRPPAREGFKSEQDAPAEGKDSLIVAALSPRTLRGDKSVGSMLASPLKRISGALQGHNVNSKYSLPPQRQTHGDKIQTLYHITAYGEDIKSSRTMLPGSKGMVGGGIYFASTPDVCKRKCLSDGWLVKARVLTGKAKIVQFGDASRSSMIAFLNQYTQLRLQAEGFDSIRVVGLRTGDEYVVYSEDQVEILKVVRLNMLEDLLDLF